MTDRPYQRIGLRMFILTRTHVKFWARQTGKTTMMAKCSLYSMLKIPGNLFTYATATLLLGRELIMKDSQILQAALTDMAAAAEHANCKLEVHDREKGDRDLTLHLTPDDFTDLFESKRMEFWVWHDNTVASRTQVIAPNVATARGWTGHVGWDEVGHTPGARELYTALEPIISTDPHFHLMMAGTPPEDDAHWSFDLFQPPVGMEFEPNAEGHRYDNEFGIPVHRVDAYDAAAAEKKTYHPVSGKEITPAEARTVSPDRDGWDRNHGLVLKIGGLRAINSLALKSAQDLGQNSCQFVKLDDDSDLDHALEWLKDNLGSGQIGLGWDLATTEKQTSNPAGFSVMEREGGAYLTRLILVWKTANEQKAEHIVSCVIDAIAEREKGGRARRLAIDATNERYFAQRMRRVLGRKVPVELVVNSETVELPGESEPMTKKAWLGNSFSKAVCDGLVALPSDRYVRDDIGRVKRDRGSFDCELGTEGQHGECFDAPKLALHSLSSSAGAILDASGIRVSANEPGNRAQFRPARLVRRPMMRGAA